jgi:predicted XRE-type DNA-binding protein
MTGYSSQNPADDEPVQKFASVWDALAETPEEAANMRLRSARAIAVRAAVNRCSSRCKGIADDAS